MIFKNSPGTGILLLWGNINELFRVWDTREGRFISVLAWLLFFLLKIVFSYQEL